MVTLVSEKRVVRKHGLSRGILVIRREAFRDHSLDGLRLTVSSEPLGQQLPLILSKEGEELVAIRVVHKQVAMVVVEMLAELALLAALVVRVTATSAAGCGEI